MKLDEQERRMSSQELLGIADERLKNLLTSPLNQLDDKYLNLLPPYARAIAGRFNLISLMALYEAAEGTRSYISFTGSNPTGWIVYRAEGSEVVEFDICSFVDGPNPVLLRDARNLFEDLVDLYDSVTFQSLPDNPFKKAYAKIVDFYHGRSWEEEGMIWYRIGDKLEEEVSAATFAETTPEHCSHVVIMSDDNAIEDLKNQTGEKV